jgi:hypothetical protein
MLQHKAGLDISISGDTARIFEDDNGAPLATRLRDLFKDAQALPGAATVTDAEIDAVRDGRFGQTPWK